MQSIKFSVAITPVSKERPRLGKFGNVYTPHKTKNAEEAIGMSARIQMGRKEPFNGRVEAKIEFTFKTPSSWSKKRKEAALLGLETPPQKDIDNLIKTVFDACNGIVYTDDKIIDSVTATKSWGEIDQITCEFTAEN